MLFHSSRTHFLLLKFDGILSLIQVKLNPKQQSYSPPNRQQSPKMLYSEPILFTEFPSMSFARIALPVPLHRYFDYILPTSLNVVVGARVWVPFGTQKRVGVVVEVAEQSDVSMEQLKPVQAYLDEVSLFSPQSWQFLQWAAGYYHAPLGEVLSQALPVKLRQGESAVEKPSVFWKPTLVSRH